MLKRIIQIASLLSLIVLAACSTASPPAAMRTGMGGYKIGKPYEVKGVWYHPKEDFSYDETGIASWYGAEFHNKNTANGEKFDKNELTAAHKTLPLPSLVRVTNLENGKSVVARVNDRGPFTPGRIIDLSQKGAELLGFEKMGTARVRVQILSEESRAIAEAAKKGVTLAKAPSTPVTAEPAVVASPVTPVSVEIAEPITKPVTPEKVDLPGKVVDNRFLPAKVVDNVPVNKNQNIWVQVGAFTVYDNAEKLKARLAEVGATLISSIKKDETQYHRVRVGPVTTVAEADQKLDRVLSLGLTGARIVVE